MWLLLTLLPFYLAPTNSLIQISSFYCKRSSVLCATSSRDRMLQRALQQIEYKRSNEDAQILPALADEPMLAVLETATRAADGRKAGYIHGMRVSGQSEVCTFMLIVEGNSRPQIQAIANAVEDDIILNFEMAPSKEGTATSGWIVLDFGSLIVHVMTPQMRNFYKIEKRWKDAEVIRTYVLLLE